MPFVQPRGVQVVSKFTPPPPSSSANALPSSSSASICTEASQDSVISAAAAAKSPAARRAEMEKSCQVRNGWVKSLNDESLHIFTKTWQPVGVVVQSVVVFVHDIMEHCERYHPFFIYFAAKGIEVQAFDMPGFGETGGRAKNMGVTGGYKVLLTEIDHAIARAVSRHPSRPIFLMGHGMGGALVLNYACGLGHQRGALAGIIVSSPYIKPSTNGAGTKFPGTYNQLSRWYPNMQCSFVVMPQELTRNREEQHRHMADMIYQGQKILVSRWKHYPVNLPALIFHGTEDPICSCKATAAVSNQIIKLEPIHFRFKSWKGTRHDPHWDNDHQIIRSEYIHWIRSLTRHFTRPPLETEFPCQPHFLAPLNRHTTSDLSDTKSDAPPDTKLDKKTSKIKEVLNPTLRSSGKKKQEHTQAESLQPASPPQPEQPPEGQPPIAATNKSWFFFGKPKSRRNSAFAAPDSSHDPSPSTSELSLHDDPTLVAGMTRASQDLVANPTQGLAELTKQLDQELQLLEEKQHELGQVKEQKEEQDPGDKMDDPTPASSEIVEEIAVLPLPLITAISTDTVDSDNGGEGDKGGHEDGNSNSGGTDGDISSITTAADNHAKVGGVEESSKLEQTDPLEGGNDNERIDRSSAESPNNCEQQPAVVPCSQAAEAAAESVTDSEKPTPEVVTVDGGEPVAKSTKDVALSPVSEQQSLVEENHAHNEGPPMLSIPTDDFDLERTTTAGSGSSTLVPSDTLVPQPADSISVVKNPNIPSDVLLSQLMKDIANSMSNPLPVATSDEMALP
ncbi:hypothetical protein BGZ73_000749 [Actinomortierella ambigua]|nr:hypothetical protein BGZ73_000749 [Actinomortierella ambigua]